MFNERKTRKEMIQMKKTMVVLFSVFLFLAWATPTFAMDLSISNTFIFASTNSFSAVIIVGIVAILALLAIFIPLMRYDKHADDSLEPKNLDALNKEDTTKNAYTYHTVPSKDQTIESTSTPYSTHSGPRHIENGPVPSLIRNASRGVVVTGALLSYMNHQRRQKKKMKKKLKKMKKQTNLA